MAHVGGRPHRLRQTGESTQNIFRTLVSKLLFEVMIMEPEGQTFFGQALVDARQHRYRRIAGDIRSSKQQRKSNRIFQLLLRHDCGRIVRQAANLRAIELRPGGLKQGIHRMAQQHELNPRHLDRPDLQRIQLNDHVVDRQPVIAVRPHADLESLRDLQRACAAHACPYAKPDTRREKPPSRSRHLAHPSLSAFVVAAGSVDTSAVANPSAHLIAPTYICCSRGSSQFSSGCPSVE